MVRKLWIVAVLAVAGLAMTPDTAEAGRRKNKNNCCPQPCNTCNTCSTASTGCSSCGGGMMAPVGVPTAPPPVAAPK